MLETIRNTAAMVSREKPLKKKEKPPPKYTKYLYLYVERSFHSWSFFLLDVFRLYRRWLSNSLDSLTHSRSLARSFESLYYRIGLLPFPSATANAMCINIHEPFHR